MRISDIAVAIALVVAIASGCLAQSCPASATFAPTYTSEEIDGPGGGWATTAEVELALE